MKIEDSHNTLPQGWAMCSIGDFTNIILGQSPPSSTYNKNEEGLPFFQGKSDFNDLYPTVRTWCIEPRKIAEKDDVLISVRAPVGPTNLSPGTSCIGRGLAAIRPLGGIDPKFVLFLLRSHENELVKMGTGSTFEAISGDTLRRFDIALPPLAEQRRIIARINILFDQIDESVRSLNRIVTLLEYDSHGKLSGRKLRDVILKQAFAGKLVPQDPNDEPASVLLKKIKDSRSLVRNK